MDSVKGALIALVVACEQPAPPPAVQRLAQPLQASDVAESPLREPAEAPVAVEVFSEDFSALEVEALGWPPGSAVVGAGPDGEPAALGFEDRKANLSLLIVPVEPNTTYRVSRRVWTASPELDLQIIESPDEPRPGETHGERVARLATERFIQARAVGALHRFPAPPAQAWAVGARTFRTSHSTHALILRLDDSMHPHGVTEAAVWLDDLRVERLAEGGAASLQLNAEPLGASGVAFRGAPLVSHDSGGAHLSQDMLYLPTPSTVRVPVSRPPAGGLLSFSYGPGPQSTPGERARLQVRLGDGVVFDEEIVVKDETDRRWRQARIPLPQADASAAITFETRSPSGGLAHVLVGSPLLLGPRPSDTPNVVLIAIDTLRADRLSSYGAPRRNSPHLDALAERGALFEQATAPSNWTAASFASLFTGLYPAEHGVIFRTRAVPEAAETLAERFAAAGWLTLGVSYKAYLHGMGFEQGFDRWFSAPFPGARGADALSVAQQWLAQHHQQPFFLFFHLNDPHQPFNHPGWFQGRRADPDVLDRLGLSLPFSANVEATWCAACGRFDAPTREMVELTRDLYDEEVLYADHIVGALLETLDAYGLSDDTIVAVVSDHGELLWEGSRLGHGGREMSDPLTQVPLIIAPHAAAGLPPRRVSSQVRALDLGPTLLDLAGVPATPYGDAESLLPLWSADGPDRPAVSQNVRSEVIAIRAAGWKLVIAHDDAVPRAMFYDLAADPAEKAPRPPPPPIRKILMDAAVAHILAHQPGPFVVVTGAPDQEHATRLRTTGGAVLAPLLGLRPDGDGWVVSGRGRWLGLARIVGDGAVLAGAPLPHAEAPLDGPGAVIVPGAATLFSDAAHAEDGDRDAALRAMGYIE